MRRSKVWIIGAVASVLLMSCRNDLTQVSGSSNRLAEITVILDSAQITVGHATHASATLRSSAGATLNGLNVTWSSSDASVARIDAQSGMVTAVAPGIISIAANSGSVRGSASLTVVAPPSQPVLNIVVSLAAPSIYVGSGTRASAVISDGNGVPVSGNSLAWASSNTSVATVNASSGAITGLNPGTTVIRASSGDLTGSASLTVVAKKVAAVEVALATSSLTAGSTTQATAVTKDSAGTALTGHAVTWSTSNAAVATVQSSTGLVKAVAAGTATIRATSDGKTGSASLTVTAKPATTKAVVLTPASATLAANGTVQFTSQRVMTDGSVVANPAVTWTATGGTITTSGLFTAGSTAGSFRAIATLADGSGFADTAAITVSAATSSTYSTTFSLAENPISESNRWINGGTTGLDWRNVRTTGGLVVATGVAQSYDDNIACLTGTFSTNQFAEATVFRASGYTAHHEVELLLNFSISAHDAHGYEVLWNTGGGIQVVRWNGGLGNFTSIALSGTDVPTTGDVLRAERQGNNIIVSRNGAVVATVNVTSIGGTVWTGGSPGVGFYAGSTLTSYGWSDFRGGSQ